MKSRVFSVFFFHCFKHYRCNWTRGSPFGAAPWNEHLVKYQEMHEMHKKGQVPLRKKIGFVSILGDGS